MKVIYYNPKQLVTNCILLLFISIFLSSCGSLKPISGKNNLQSLTPDDIHKFDGDYEIISIDSAYRTLENGLTDKNYFNHEHDIGVNDKINLQAIDNRHIKVSVISNDTIITTKILKGHLSQNYFNFSLLHFSPIYIIINGIRRQKNRIGILQSGELTLDTKFGGFLLLLILPTFGDGAEFYDLKFRRLQK